MGEVFLELLCFGGDRPQPALLWGTSTSLPQSALLSGVLPWYTGQWQLLGGNKVEDKNRNLVFS